MYWQVKVMLFIANFSSQKLWWESSVCRAHPSWFVMFVFHVWVTTENGVRWTGLCFYPLLLIFIYEGEISESGSQNEWLLVIGPYMDWLLICWEENCKTATKEPGTIVLQICDRDWRNREDNKLNKNKCVIDQEIGQVDRILTQWWIRDPQKTHVNSFFTPKPFNEHI